MCVPGRVVVLRFCSLFVNTMGTLVSCRKNFVADFGAGTNTSVFVEFFFPWGGKLHRVFLRKRFVVAVGGALKVRLWVILRGIDLIAEVAKS